jgi:hypothetical protein
MLRFGAQVEVTADSSDGSSRGAEKRPFLIHKNDQFTKPGSGQTQERR